MTCEASAEVTNHFSPEITHLPFFFTALVLTIDGSEPACGSVMA